MSFGIPMKVDVQVHLSTMISHMKDEPMKVGRQSGTSPDEDLSLLVQAQALLQRFGQQPVDVNGGKHAQVSGSQERSMSCSTATSTGSDTASDIEVPSPNSTPVVPQTTLMIRNVPVLYSAEMLWQNGRTRALSISSICLGTWRPAAT
jgi:hypothetical protein